MNAIEGASAMGEVIKKNPNSGLAILFAVGLLYMTYAARPDPWTGAQAAAQEEHFNTRFDRIDADLNGIRAEIAQHEKIGAHGGALRDIAGILATMKAMAADLARIEKDGGG